MTTNQTTMTGPNTRPTLPVPRYCMANSATITATLIGRTKSFSSGAETSRPSTADSTEMAGVITPSPKNRQAPAMPTRAERIAHAGADRDALRQRHQRQDAALAAVVGAHDQGDVFDRDDQDQRPEDQRQDAEDLDGADRDAVEQLEAGLEGVERAGADIAIDDAEHGQQQTSGGQRLARALRHGGRRQPPLRGCVARNVSVMHCPKGKSRCEPIIARCAKGRTHTLPALLRQALVEDGGDQRSWGKTEPAWARRCHSVSWRTRVSYALLSNRPVGDGIAAPVIVRV